MFLNFFPRLKFINHSHNWLMIRQTTKDNERIKEVHSIISSYMVNNSGRTISDSRWFGDNVEGSVTFNCCKSS